MAEHKTPSTTVLRLHRIALVLSALAFGAVGWFRAGDGWEQGPKPDEGPLRIIVGVAIAISLVATIVVRSQLTRIVDPAIRAQRSILAWSAGEAAALAGGAFYFLRGEPRWFLVGLVMLLASLVIIPAPYGAQGARG